MSKISPPAVDAGSQCRRRGVDVVGCDNDEDFDTGPTDLGVPIDVESAFFDPACGVAVAQLV